MFTLVFSVLLVFLSAFARVDALYETDFVVGPDRQPVALDDGSGGGVRADDMFLPTASIPNTDSEGGRNLKDMQPHSTITYEGVGSSVHNSYSKQDDQVSSSFDIRYRNVTAPESRSLAGETCSITNTILGFRFDDNVAETGNTWIPADPHGAVGFRRLVAVVNSMLEVRQKDDGTLKFRDGFQSFFSAFPQASGSHFFFDPKVIYDEREGRFVIIVLQRWYSPQLSRIWLAVSKDETPDVVTDWNQFYIDSALTIDGSKVFADFPGLEVDEEAVYITANMYRFSDGVYGGVRLWWFGKGVSGGFYNGLPFTTYVANPFTSAGIAATTVPAQVHGSSGVDGTIGTFLATIIVFDNGQVCLQIYTFFTPLASPAYTIQTICLGIITQGYEMTLAPQRGSSVKINTNNAQALDAVLRNGKLWVVFTINPTSGANQGQATAHWVRLGTSGETLSFEAQGNLGGEGIATGTFTYFPSVAVNTQGIVAYGYAASSPTTYVGAYVSVGTSEQSYTVKSGLAPYVRQYETDKNRWGDYSAISVDKADDSFWVFNQYADTTGSLDSGGNGRWATAWSRLVCTVSSLLVLCFVDCF
jgi:hypothetical protein